jgi:acyl-CoA hydrolase
MDCIAPAGVGPLVVTTEVLRVGKSLSHVRATLSQHGKTCAIVLGAFGQALSSQLHVPGPSAPAWPQPAEQLERLPYVPGVTPAFTQHFDSRWTSRPALFSGAERGTLSGYVRALDADVVDAAVIAALIDAFPAPVLLQLRAPAPASTVTWLVNLVDPQLAPPLPPTAFCRYESHTNSAHAGYASFDAKLWDDTGRLLADSRQLVVEFS